MSKITSKENNDLRKWILPIAAGVVGIALLIFGGRSEKSEKKENVEAFAQDGTELSATAFAEAAEERIVGICSGVAGVGEVQAVVSLEGGYRAVYASDVQGSDGSYRNQTVLRGSGSSEQAILVGYDAPRIVGIGIVCTGGDDPTVRKNVTMLVSAAFDVSANKIYVTGSK